MTADPRIIRDLGDGWTITAEGKGPYPTLVTPDGLKSSIVQGNVWVGMRSGIPLDKLRALLDAAEGKTTCGHPYAGCIREPGHAGDHWFESK